MAPAGIEVPVFREDFRRWRRRRSGTYVNMVQVSICPLAAGKSRIFGSNWGNALPAGGKGTRLARAFESVRNIRVE